jgi:hypothetical protein
VYSIDTGASHLRTVVSTGRGVLIRIHVVSNLGSSVRIPDCFDPLLGSYLGSLVTMVFSLKTLVVVTSLFSSTVDAFPTGAGGCIGGGAAVMSKHVTPAEGKTIVTGYLADGGVTLLLNGNPLTSGPAAEFVAATPTLQILTIAGSSDFRGLLVRLSAPDGVDTDMALFEISDDLRSADNVCTAPVVGITHANRNLKNQQSMSLSIAVPAVITLDVTVVFANDNKRKRTTISD